MDPASGSPRIAEASFIIALSALIGVVSVGVVRRWRWIFWAIMIVFALGVLRVPVTVLQLSGHIRASGPAWYAGFQGVTAAIQVTIAILMLVGYRRSGVWGGF